MFDLSKKTVRRIKKTLHGTVTIISSASILISSMTQAYAQAIIVDPSAPGTSFLQSENGTPLINIMPPQGGVSVNQFTEFNVGDDGLIINNSTTNGVSVIGQGVTANPNLMVSGPANTIVNEVTSAAPSSLTGTTEVFGQSAAVIIANPNGISCNGCDFLNSTSSILTTGTPQVSGGDVDLLVTQGTVTVGPEGFDAGAQGGLVGRHVIVNGPVSTDGQGADNNLLISGGAQQATIDFNALNDSQVVAAPDLGAKTSPFAVDISEAGTLSSGDITVRNRESGQGVNLYGDISGRSLYASSAGNLFYRNVDVTGDVSVFAEDVRQYGDLYAEGDVTLWTRSYTLYDGRILEAGIGEQNPDDPKGDIAIRADDFIVIAGEVSGSEDIFINAVTGTVTNTGFILADDDLIIIAGDSFTQQREIASEYDIYFDPALQQYLQAYQAQLLAGGEEADIAAEMIARASEYELIAEYIDQGATATGTNVWVNTYSGDITNTGGAIAATNDVRLVAGANIINEYLALRTTLDAEDGCSGENCGYRTDFHAGEILAGNDLILTAELNIENRASDMAAANNIILTAGQDVINALTNSQFDAEEDLTVELTYVIPERDFCNKAGCGTIEEQTVDYTGNDYHFNEVNVLSPARIVSLYGNVSISAGRDFLSQASEITSGGDLTINATGQAVLTSYTDIEDRFIDHTTRTYETRCTIGKDGTCNTGVFTNVTREDGTVLRTATTELVGRNVRITSGADLTILGARIFAAGDLSLRSTDGSVLISAADLPTDVALPMNPTGELIELTDDLVSQIFGSSDHVGDVSELSGAYSSLITSVAFVDSTFDTLVDDALNIILEEIVATWRAGLASDGSAPVSSAIETLLTDPAEGAERRDALAERLIYLVGATLGDAADTLDGSTTARLDEYALLQQLISTGANNAAVHSAALALVDALAAELLVSTQAVEATATPVPSLNPIGSLEQTTAIFDLVVAQLENYLPSEITDENIAAFESLAGDDAFIAALVFELANQTAVDLGRDPYFASISDLNDHLSSVEHNTDLYRLVSELSWIFSPREGNTAPEPAELFGDVLRVMSEDADLEDILEGSVTFIGNTVSDVRETLNGFDETTDEQVKFDTLYEQLSALLPNPVLAEADRLLLTQQILDNTVFDRNVRRVAQELQEFGPSLSAAVANLILDTDLQAQEDAFVDQDLSGVSVEAGLSDALIQETANSLGAQAAENLEAQVASDRQTYLNLLADNNLLTAVEALRRAESGADIKEAARAVGVQSYVSLIDSTHLTTLRDDAQMSIDAVYDILRTDLAAHDAIVATSHADFRDALTDLEERFGLNDAERTAETEAALLTVTADYDAAVASAQDVYAQALADNDAQYGPLLTKQEERTRTVSSGKGSYTETYYVTVDDPYYIDLKNAADTLAQSELTAALTDVETQIQLNTLFVQASFTDEGITAEIATLADQFYSEINVLAGQKLDLLVAYNTQTSDALRRAEVVLQQEVIEDDLRNEYVANGTVVEGESSLAAALTTQAFPELSLIRNLATNADGLVENHRAGDVAQTRLVTHTRDVGEFQDQISIISQPVYTTTCGGKTGDCYTSITSYNEVEVTETVWTITGTEEYLEEEVYFDGTPSQNPLFSADQAEQDAFLNATAWRFATATARDVQSPRNHLFSQRDLTVTAPTGVLLGQGDFDALGTLNVSGFGGVVASSAGLSGNRIDITTGANFTGRGVVFEAVNDIDIAAFGSVDISALGRSYTSSDGYENIVGALDIGVLDQSFGYVDDYGTFRDILELHEWQSRLSSSAVSQELSSITAGGDLIITAGPRINGQVSSIFASLFPNTGNLTFGGVTANVSGDVSLTAIGDIAFIAPRSVVEYHYGSDSNGVDLWDIDSHVTNITSGGNFSALAGRSAFLEGTRITAEGSLSLAATNGITISAAQDVHEYNHRTHSSGLLSSRSSLLSITRLVNEGASLSAGGDIDVESETGNLITAGSEFISHGGNINLSATQGDILAGAFTDIDRTVSQSSSSSLFGLFSSSAYSLADYRTATGTAALAGVDLTIVAGGDLELVGARLSAGRDLNINVGGDLRILAAIDSAQEEYFETNSGAIYITTVTETSHREDAVLTTISADGEVSFSIGGETYLTLYSHEGEEGPTAAELYPDELLALANLVLLDQELLDEYFYEETKALSPAFIAVVTIALTAGYGQLLINAAAAPGANLGALVTSAGQLTHAGTAVVSFATSSTVGVANGVVSGDLDLGDILANAAISAATALATSALDLQAAGDFLGADDLQGAANSVGEAVTSLDSISVLGASAEWSEALSTSLFGLNNLSVANVLEGAFDATISSGVNSAIYGTSFGDGFQSSLISTVVSLGLADVHNEIGTIFRDSQGNPINGGEGSFAHVALHGIAGCAAAELQGADCRAGAAGAIASAIAAGYFQNNPLQVDSNLSAQQQANLRRTREQQIAQLLSATVGFLFSGGDSNNVNIAATVGRSAIANNRQLHERELDLIEEFSDEFAIELGLCADEASCSQENLDAARRLLIRQAGRQVSQFLALYTEEDIVAREFLESIAPSGYIPGTEGSGDYLNENQEYFRATEEQFDADLINVLVPLSNPQVFEAFALNDEAGIGLSNSVFLSNFAAWTETDAHTLSPIARLEIGEQVLRLLDEVNWDPINTGIAVNGYRYLIDEILPNSEEYDSLSTLDQERLDDVRLIFAILSGQAEATGAGEVSLPVATIARITTRLGLRNFIATNRTLTPELRDEIVATPGGSRPDPSTYMSQAEIDAHLALFDDGAVRLTLTENVERFGNAGPDGGFLMPRAEFDRIVQETGGDLAQLEQRLGLNPGDLTSGNVSALSIDRADLPNLRVPSGNEGGAINNSNWLPGGYTSGGVAEAVADISNAPFEILQIN